MKLKIIILFINFTMLIACANNDVLTKKEMEIQGKADSVVANTLFDSDLNDKASYNVSKSGSVTIKFAESVKEKDYTRVVNLLRSNSAVDGVYAEQSGQEVCGVP